MDITISYNGSIAICKVNDKPINKVTSLEIAQAFHAFDTVKQSIERELRWKSLK